jgi:hypothetical protein
MRINNISEKLFLYLCDGICWSICNAQDFIQEVLRSNLDCGTNYSDLGAFFSFPRSFQENFGAVFQVGN